MPACREYGLCQATPDLRRLPRGVFRCKDVNECARRQVAGSAQTVIFVETGGREPA